MDKSDKILPSASPTEHGMKNTIEATDYFFRSFFFGWKQLVWKWHFLSNAPAEKNQEETDFLGSTLVSISELIF